MAIVIPTGGSGVSDGDLTTFAGLVATLADWLNRYDLGGQVAEFVMLFEARLNRILRVPEMEASATLTVTGNLATLPPELREIRHVYWNGDADNELVPVPLSTIRRDYPLSSYTGRPLVYAVRGGEIEVAPLPGSSSGNLTILYYEEINALSTDNQTNWLIVSHPDIYLYGSLVMAEAFIWDDERIGLWKSALDEALEELKNQGVSKHYGGGPLFPRPIPRPGAKS